MCHITLNLYFFLSISFPLVHVCIPNHLFLIALCVAEAHLWLDYKINLGYNYLFLGIRKAHITHIERNRPMEVISRVWYSVLDEFR